MCYKKPGPRCSKHAGQMLRAAFEKGDPQEILRAQDIFDETPLGQEQLKDAIDAMRESGHESEAIHYEARRESAKVSREAKMNRLKAQYPDEKENFSYDQHQEEENLAENTSPVQEAPYSEEFIEQLAGDVAHHVNPIIGQYRLADDAGQEFDRSKLTKAYKDVAKSMVEKISVSNKEETLASKKPTSSSANPAPDYADTMDNITTMAVFECQKQHVGLSRVIGYLSAQQMLLDMKLTREEFHADPEKTVELIKKIAGIVEPDNHGQFRASPVTFADGGTSAHHSDIERLVYSLVEHGDGLTAEEWTKEFVWVHPYVDGNGRSGAIWFNFLNGTLHNPIKMPRLFGES